MRAIFCVLILFSIHCHVLVVGSYCHGKPQPNAQPNTKPVVAVTPVFVSSVANGKLFNITIDGLTVPIVHLWGTPYEKGVAHGTLMKERITNFIADFWAYMESEVEREINKTKINFPPGLEQGITDWFLNTSLDLTSDWTEPYTGAYFDEEIHGISDASGVSFDQIRRVHMIGELTKGSCSMFGAWGDAVANSTGGLLSMRALDWITDGPFQHYHQLTIYHPQPNSEENTFLNVGWSGWVGSITGVNDKLMSIHEIGVAFPDETFGAESRQGVPFTYVLRDVLQFDPTIDAGLQRLNNSHRTCDLILGIGDGKAMKFNSIEYSASIMYPMDDTNMRPVADWHPVVPSMVYHGMDWLCPGYNQVLGQQLQTYWSQLTPQIAISHVLPIVQTGSLHAFVADLVAQQFFLSVAAPATSKFTPPAVDAPSSWSVDPINGLKYIGKMIPLDNHPYDAFNRGWVQIDLRSIWSVTQDDEQW